MYSDTQALVPSCRDLSLALVWKCICLSLCVGATHVTKLDCRSGANCFCLVDTCSMVSGGLKFLIDYLFVTARSFGFISIILIPQVICFLHTGNLQDLIIN